MKLRVDERFGKIAQQSAQRYSRRSFLGRAGRISVGAALTPVLAETLWPRQALASDNNHCGSAVCEIQQGFSVLCASLSYWGYNSCATGWADGGSWCACLPAGSYSSKCGTANESWFGDCCANCAPYLNPTADPFGNKKSCYYECEWGNTSLKVICRRWGCTNSVCKHPTPCT